MGMFDTIICDYPLPDNCPYTDFQTKDLENLMDIYKITKEGALLKEECDYEKEESKDSFFGYYMKKVNIRWKDMNYHGDLDFYTYNTETKEWYEYIVRFTHGIVEYIRRKENEVS